MEPPSATEQRARQGVKLLIFFRLLLAVVAIIVILIGSIGRSGGGAAGSQERVVYAIVTFVILLTLGYSVALQWVRNHFAFAFVQIVVDIAIISVLVYLTGGVESHLVFLYFASILAASMTLSGRMAVFFASEATCLLAAVTIAYYLGYAPFGVASTAELMRPERIGSVLTFHFAQAVSFFLVALLSSSLARRLTTARIFNEEILESIGQGIAAFDSEDILTFANTEIGRILGRRPPRPGETVPEVFAADGEEPIVSGILSRDSRLFELELARPDGSAVPLRIKTVPVRAPGAGYRGTVAVVTDLTLERRVEEAMTQAERASAIGEMSASIAHEIRNPLASIRGAIQEIERGSEFPPERRMLMDIVVSESDRLDNIISDFLDFARMRPVRKVSCDMASIISESVALIERAAADGKRVAFEVDLPGPLPLHADSEQIRQVLLNLGLNSIAAIANRPAAGASPGGTSGGGTPAPVGTMRISARSETGARFAGEAGKIDPEADRSGVAVEFADDGAGMDDETARRAFDPFFTTRMSGSGLGLSVVSRIIRGHGGRVELHSAPGEGTTVHFWVPLS